MALTVTASAVMAVSQKSTDVMAEDVNSSTANKIDQSLFATKGELQSVFSVDNRQGEIVGKIVFGTDVEDNNSGQIWYIVGSETNRTGDNINLFAVDNIGGDVVWGRGEDVVDWDTNDYSDYNYSVTYAGSTLNDAMDEDYFTLAEQSLMNDTVVKYILYSVNDGSLNKGNYNITSKLYPVESDIDYVVDYGYDDYTGLYSDDLKVSLGTNNGYNVDIKKYVWGQGEPFFLRDSYKYPYNGYRYSLRVKPAYFDTNATESDLDDLLAKKQVNINTSNYEYDTVTSGVRPAFNLNITNVLFASAVPTKNGTGYSIEDDAAMELRFDGSSMNLGNVVLDDVFINENNYEVEDDDAVEDDMLVKIKSSYLEELPIGEHEIELVWDDGTVSMVIAIEAADQGGEDPDRSSEEVPETGDNINIIQPLMILIVAALVTVVLLSTKRKKA